MYRLKFRWKSAAGIGALIVGAVLMFAMPFIVATQGLSFDLPAAPIAAAQLVLPLLFALYTYRLCPFIQQIRAFLVTSSLLGFFGLIANNCGFPLYGFQVIQQDWLLHFNAATLGAMNLAALVAASNLMQAEQMSSFADTKVAEAQLERLKAVKVDPETQAKWEKAAAYADRSADGRSLRSTMTNLKAISLTEPGQELKPTVRENDKERTTLSQEKGQKKPNGDDGSLANLLDRMDDQPLGEESEDLSAVKRDPALEGNSFINDVSDNESTASGSSFLDSILDAKLGEEDIQSPELSAETSEESALIKPSAFIADLDLPKEEAETTDVAALLDSFPDESSDTVAIDAADPSEPAMDFSMPTGGAFLTPEDIPAQETEPTAAEPSPKPSGAFELKPTVTTQFEDSSPQSKPETTRASSFASASSSRNSMPAMQPLTEGASAEVSALSADTTSNFPVPNTSPSGFTPNTQTAPSNTNNKLAAMKRRNTSTFTKLNALSASGSGALSKPPEETDNEPDSLRSLLDRLDDDKVDEAAPKVQEAAKPLEPPAELTLDHVFRDDTAPPVAATPTTVAQKRPVETEAAKAPEPEILPETAYVSASEEVQESSEVVAERSGALEVPAQPEAAPLASFDRSIDEEESAEEAYSATTIGAASATETEVEAEEVREPVFGQGVDADIDDIFSELAPQEAQLEVGQKMPQASEKAAPASVLKATEPEAEAPEVAAPEAEAPEAEAPEAEAPELSLSPLADEEEPAAASEPLFGSGVDGEIDNIFSELAPPEAQKEVADVMPRGTTSSAAAPIRTEAPADELEEAQGSLFEGGIDSEIDDIFSELAPPEAQKEVKDVLGAAKPAPAAFKSVPAAIKPESAAELSKEAETEAESESGLFGAALGQELDDIFSGLTEGPQLEVNSSTLARVKGDGDSAQTEPKVETPAPPPAPAKPAAVEKPVAAEIDPAPTTAGAKAEPAKYKEVKEFGRLSAKPSTVSKFGSETTGTMKTIGKLLLDVQAVENIIKSGENRKIGTGLSTAKIISAARGEGIKNILNSIDTYEGVAGSLIVGHDGLVIASTVGTGWDKDMLGALSTALLSTSNLATKKLEIGKLRQMVMLTALTNCDGQQFKTTVLTDVDVGILAVFLEKTDLNRIDGLLETIHTTIHGG